MYMSAVRIIGEAIDQISRQNALEITVFFPVINTMLLYYTIARVAEWLCSFCMIKCHHVNVCNTSLGILWDNLLARRSP